MKIFLYSSHKSNIEDSLIKMLSEELNIEDLSINRSYPSLGNNLINDLIDESIVIICCYDKQEIIDILKISNLLSNRRIILLIPNSDPNTLSLAHQIYPRFMTEISSDLDEVRLVINKMITKTNGDMPCLGNR